MTTDAFILLESRMRLIYNYFLRSLICGSPTLMADLDPFFKAKTLDLDMPFEMLLVDN